MIPRLYLDRNFPGSVVTLERWKSNSCNCSGPSSCIWLERGRAPWSARGVGKGDGQWTDKLNESTLTHYFDVLQTAEIFYFQTHYLR